MNRGVMDRAVSKRLLVSVDPHQTRIAVVEDGRLAESYAERSGRLPLVGNIYKGRVENVLAGMEAAFVDIGAGRNGHLSVDDIPDREGRASAKDGITRVLRSGQEIVVQVSRQGTGSKGPRLTADIGLPGRYVVYSPYATKHGVSRRLDDEERERLRSLVHSLGIGSGGVIVRTAAEGVEREAIERDVAFLQRVWAEVERRIEEQDAPSLVYREPELAVRAVRDLLASDFDEVLVDQEESWHRLREYVKAVAPGCEERVRLYQGERPLFVQYGVDKQLRAAAKRRVELPSGAYLVIDRTEAMTVIDVNTGGYVGRRRLEETALKTNVQACRAIAEQLRLRDIGGIVVIDFIGMESRGNQQAVLVTLEAELKKDRAKTHVAGISSLGLVQMTRQSVGRGTGDALTVLCPTCGGEGRIPSEASATVSSKHTEQAECTEQAPDRPPEQA